jgi:hypothetical protein
MSSRLDRDDVVADELINNVNDQILCAAPGFALGQSMLAVAAAFSRDTVSASNQLQLNGIAAMAETVKQINHSAGRARCARTVTEALDLLRQVAAQAQGGG